MTPIEFDTWWAAYLTGRMDDGWSQAAMVCSVVVNLAMEIAAGFSGKKLSEEDLVSPALYMPPFSVGKSEGVDRPDSKSVETLGKLLAEKFRGKV